MKVVNDVRDRKKLLVEHQAVDTRYNITSGLDCELDGQISHPPNASLRLQNTHPTSPLPCSRFPEPSKMYL